MKTVGQRFTGMNSDSNVKIPFLKKKVRHEKRGKSLKALAWYLKMYSFHQRIQGAARTRNTEKICVLERDVYSLARPAASEEQHSAAHVHHGFCLTGTTLLKDKDIKPAGCEGSPSGSGLLLGSLEYLTFLISRNEPERFPAGEERQGKRMRGFSLTYGLLEERDT